MFTNMARQMFRWGVGRSVQLLACAAGYRWLWNSKHNIIIIF